MPLGVVFEAGAVGFRTTGVTVAVAFGLAGTLRCLLELLVVGLTGTESSESEEYAGLLFLFFWPFLSASAADLDGTLLFAFLAAGVAAFFAGGCESESVE